MRPTGSMGASCVVIWGEKHSRERDKQVRKAEIEACLAYPNEQKAKGAEAVKAKKKVRDEDRWGHLLK